MQASEGAGDAAAAAADAAAAAAAGGPLLSPPGVLTAAAVAAAYALYLLARRKRVKNLPAHENPKVQGVNREKMHSALLGFDSVPDARHFVLQLASSPYVFMLSGETEWNFLLFPTSEDAFAALGEMHCTRPEAGCTAKPPPSGARWGRRRGMHRHTTTNNNNNNNNTRQETGHLRQQQPHDETEEVRSPGFRSPVRVRSSTSGSFASNISRTSSERERIRKEEEEDRKIMEEDERRRDAEMEVGWSRLPVPSNWQLYFREDPPVYTNVKYPFVSSLAPPPLAPKHNPTGLYRIYFDLPARHSGRRIFIVFGGADSALYFWLNDTFVGFSKDSRLPAEFDVSQVVAVADADTADEHIAEHGRVGRTRASGGRNVLDVVVQRWSDGSHVEDQDMWNLSGLFRDVYIYSLPPVVAIRDFNWTCSLDMRRKQATVEVCIVVEWCLQDHQLRADQDRSQDWAIQCELFREGLLVDMDNVSIAQDVEQASDRKRRKFVFERSHDNMPATATCSYIPPPPLCSSAHRVSHSTAERYGAYPFANEPMEILTAQTSHVTDSVAVQSDDEYDEDGEFDDEDEDDDEEEEAEADEDEEEEEDGEEEEKEDPTDVVAKHEQAEDKRQQAVNAKEVFFAGDNDGNQKDEGSVHGTGAAPHAVASEKTGFSSSGARRSGRATKSSAESSNGNSNSGARKKRNRPGGNGGVRFAKKGVSFTHDVVHDEPNPPLCSPTAEEIVRRQQLQREKLQKAQATKSNLRVKPYRSRTNNNSSNSRLSKSKSKSARFSATAGLGSGEHERNNAEDGSAPAERHRESTSTDPKPKQGTDTTRRSRSSSTSGRRSSGKRKDRSRTRRRRRRRHGSRSRERRQGHHPAGTSEHSGGTDPNKPQIVFTSADWRSTDPWQTSGSRAWGGVGSGTLPYDTRQFCMRIVHRMNVTDAHLWSAETPYCYSLVVSLLNCVDGSVVQAESCRVGLRTVGIEDGQLRVNGKPILVRGANRHEHCDTHGHAVTPVDIERDICIMKQLNFNALRTSHYPNSSWTYELCTVHGLYVVDEANIETHGMKPYAGRLANDTEWNATFMQRAVRMYARDKVHPCIIAWSLGNESGYGWHHDRLANWLRQTDRSRVIIYEPASYGRDLSRAPAGTTLSLSMATDILCPMYAPIDRCISLANRFPDLPIILSEYSHCMGNSGGNINVYWDAFKRYTRLQGGFVWDLVDQGLRVQLPSSYDPDAIEEALATAAANSNRNNTRVSALTVDTELWHHLRWFWAYGGDFGERRNDGNFCCNGLLWPDRLPKPSALELKHCMRPFRCTLEKVAIVDENDAEAMEISYARIGRQHSNQQLLVLHLHALSDFDHVKDMRSLLEFSATLLIDGRPPNVDCYDIHMDVEGSSVRHHHEHHLQAPTMSVQELDLRVSFPLWRTHEWLYATAWAGPRAGADATNSVPGWFDLEEGRSRIYVPLPGLSVDPEVSVLVTARLHKSVGWAPRRHVVGVEELRLRRLGRAAEMHPQVSPLPARSRHAAIATAAAAAAAARGRDRAFKFPAPAVESTSPAHAASSTGQRLAPYATHAFVPGSQQPQIQLVDPVGGYLASIDQKTGLLCSVLSRGEELLAPKEEWERVADAPLRLQLHRALTDNDRGGYAHIWETVGLDDSWVHGQDTQIRVTTGERGGAPPRVEARFTMYPQRVNYAFLAILLRFNSFRENANEGRLWFMNLTRAESRFVHRMAAVYQLGHEVDIEEQLLFQKQQRRRRKQQLARSSRVGKRNGKSSSKGGRSDKAKSASAAAAQGEAGEGSEDGLREEESLNDFPDASMEADKDRERQEANRDVRHFDVAYEAAAALAMAAPSPAQAVAMDSVSAQRRSGTWSVIVWKTALPAVTTSPLADTTDYSDPFERVSHEGTGGEDTLWNEMEELQRVNTMSAYLCPEQLNLGVSVTLSYELVPGREELEDTLVEENQDEKEGEEHAQEREEQRNAVGVLGAHNPSTKRSSPRRRMATRQQRQAQHQLRIRARVDCSHLPCPLPRVGLQLLVRDDLDRVTWFGRGPHENYADRCASTFSAVHSCLVEDLFVPYSVPSENGNRSGVRWVQLTAHGPPEADEDGERVLGLRFWAKEEGIASATARDQHHLNFSAHRHLTEDLQAAGHPHELGGHGRPFIAVNLDGRMMGVGGDDSWTASVHEQHLVHAGTFTTEMLLQPL